VVTAVNRPELRAAFPDVDILVLSADPRGLSLSSACSGGDLDGDQFACIWHPDLVPPKRNEQPPLDYSRLAREAAARTKPQLAVDSAHALEDFFVRVISNECLGRVSHMHLALSDLLPQSAMNPVCMRLAEAQSLAVDFPKTGVPPQVGGGRQRLGRQGEAVSLLVLLPQYTVVSRVSLVAPPYHQWAWD
jgi:RNA-dependent RNA polymerase